MKHHVLVPVVLILASIFLFPSLSRPEEFLGAPVLPHGDIIKKTKSRLVKGTSLSHEEVLSYYKKELEDMDNIKYREWEDETYIEDDGARSWHSITISKGGEKETTVTITKDSWTWIMGTLLLRFVAVFVVLLVLFLGMSLSGKILYSWTQRKEKKKKEG